MTPDGTPGPTGEGGFEAEPGRYHLYVAFGCPWAHRTLIFRKLKGLEDHISVSFTLPRRTDEGWVFDSGVRTRASAAKPCGRSTRRATRTLSPTQRT